MKDKVKKILNSNQAKDYSKVGKEVIENFEKWLEFSCVSKSDFISYINSSELMLKVNFESEQNCCVYFLKDNKRYCEAFVEDVNLTDDKTKHEQFLIEVSLLLMYILNFVKTDINLKYMLNFVKKDLIYFKI